MVDYLMPLYMMLSHKELSILLESALLGSGHPKETTQIAKLCFACGSSI